MTTFAIIWEVNRQIQWVHTRFMHLSIKIKPSLTGRKKARPRHLEGCQTLHLGIQKWYVSWLRSSLNTWSLRSSESQAWLHTFKRCSFNWCGLRQGPSLQKFSEWFKSTASLNHGPKFWSKGTHRTDLLFSISKGCTRYKTAFKSFSLMVLSGIKFFP